MNKKQRLVMRSVILVVMLAAIGYTMYINFFQSKEIVDVGDKAPNFVLTDLEGNEVMLSDYEGKGVFLNFWGTWCKPCEREMPYMENQYQVYKDQGVEILAVNIQETNLAVERFRDRHGLTFPIPMDRSDQVRQAYGIMPLPTTILLDENGTVVKKSSGELSEENVREFMEMIKPKQ
ncbi:thiol-disulfide oxidoreductase ResA [Sutcliffiella rhizosphaerae]|uniref:Thiol-disulfide oxidoreductase ResA n=1 Tax=Sutcliffiella rhizosphaerae TaxID=2880967 RepID=A0ABM8YR81_9BACI|nr:thiol-disulfide oxidoreductase ResA [Sutcliffiella rhizosphaerae]CAG9622336.1 Thiol-disulfide oxidoreductase ResA [Sutcliffiella rhizosphaerae]